MNVKIIHYDNPKKYNPKTIRYVNIVQRVRTKRFQNSYKKRWNKYIIVIKSKHSLRKWVVVVVVGGGLKQVKFGYVYKTWEEEESDVFRLPVCLCVRQKQIVQFPRILKLFCSISRMAALPFQKSISRIDKTPFLF